MKNKIFSTPEEENQMTFIMAGVTLHALITSGLATKTSGKELVDKSFDIAEQFTVRAKELLR